MFYIKIGIITAALVSAFVLQLFHVADRIRTGDRARDIRICWPPKFILAVAFGFMVTVPWTD